MNIGKEVKRTTVIPVKHPIHAPEPAHKPVPQREPAKAPEKVDA